MSTSSRAAKVRALGIGVLGATLLFASVACESDADVASRNVSKDADNFKVQRKIIFYNTVSDKVMFEIDGLCSLGNMDKKGELSVTCKTGPHQYEKHFLGLSKNVTYMTLQIGGHTTSTSNYKVVFKPSTIVPDVELR